MPAPRKPKAAAAASLNASVRAVLGSDEAEVKRRAAELAEPELHHEGLVLAQLEERGR